MRTCFTHTGPFAEL